MNHIRYFIGLDISTQTISAMLIGVAEESGAPTELVISSAWMDSRLCRDEISRKSPRIWIDLVRDCISRLKKKTREAELVEGIGVSTTFPSCFIILKDGSIDPEFVSLYDNSSDEGLCEGAYEAALGDAELETLNRMWPGNAAIGLAHLVRSHGLDLNMAARIVPASTAFACELLRTAGCGVDASDVVTDLTQAAISGLYDPRSGKPVPPAVARLVEQACPGIDIERLRTLLPGIAPSWRNIIPNGALRSVRALLGLPKLRSISIGAGDSALGALALASDRNTVINVRGSSDSPMIMVDAPRPRDGERETVLHYPMPTAVSLSDQPWCVVAPLLRTGRVWDWVRRLRFADDDPDADARLEEMAVAAYARGGNHPVFNTALGGERAPDWDPLATGSISGLVEAHGIGDIALAALEGMSKTLSVCIDLMEKRYRVRTTNMLVVGGPARNALWNRITQAHTGKKTFATTFSDASLLGAALLGYAAAHDGLEPDEMISKRLAALSKLSSEHELISPVGVGALVDLDKE